MKQVLDKGPSLKMFKEAHQLYLSGFEDQALSRYIYLAALGFEVANFNAGFILEHSKDPKHFQRAAFFYRRSAQMDNAEARKKVGDAFYKLGDEISAVAHYIVAAKAENPDPEAMFNLGYAYETGIGLKKDLWSAMDLYAASLSRGKSGRIAVRLALAKVKAKLILEKLKNTRRSKYRKSPMKPKKESDKVITMFITLLFIGVIYWYMNYFQPRQERVRIARNHVQNNVRHDSNTPELNNERVVISETVISPSIHSDSSNENSTVELTEFRFRRTPKTTSNDLEETESMSEVD